MAFTYLKAKSAKCLCLLSVVLVLLFRSWSLKYLVLFTSLTWRQCQRRWQAGKCNCSNSPYTALLFPLSYVRTVRQNCGILALVVSRYQQEVP